MLFGDSAFSELPFATDTVGTRAEIVVDFNRFKTLLTTDN